jgi:hypothetical protein
MDFLARIMPERTIFDLISRLWKSFWRVFRDFRAARITLMTRPREVGARKKKFPRRLVVISIGSVGPRALAKAELGGFIGKRDGKVKWIVGEVSRIRL